VQQFRSSSRGIAVLVFLWVTMVCVVATASASTAKPAVGSSLGQTEYADMNGDGLLDQVRLQYPNLQVSLQDAGGAYVPQPAVTVSCNNRFVLGRFDADSVVDVLMGPCGGTNRTAEYQIYRGLGDGRLEATSPVYGLSDSLVFEIRAVDLNRDGHTDLVGILHRDHVEVELLMNPGDIRAGTWTMPFPMSHDFSDENVWAGDVDGDGFPDLLGTLVPADGWHETSVLTVAFGDGTGGFPVVRSFAITLQHPDVLVSDTDGDGHPDVTLSGGHPAGSTEVIRGLGGHRLDAPQWVWNRPGLGPVTAALHLRHDAPRDLMFAASGNDSAWVMRRDADGLYSPASLFGLGLAPIAWYDQNGDGLDDYLSWGDGRATVRWFLNDGLGGFTPGAESALQAGYGLRFVDMNSDGRPDLLTWTDAAVRISTASADGSFGPAQDTGIHRLAPFDSLGWSDVIAGDLDGNGLGDVVIAARHGCDPAYILETWLNEGGGAFGFIDTVGVANVKTYYRQGDECTLDTYASPRLMCGDINGDGRADIVMPRGWRSSDYDEAYGFASFLAAEDGHLVKLDAEPYGYGTSVLADVTHHGRSQLVSLSNDDYGDAYVNVRSWGASGGTESWTGSRIAWWAAGLAVADLDGDTWPEIVTSSSSWFGQASTYSVVEILRNSGSDAVTPVLASLVSATATAGHVHVEWELAGAAGTPVAIERSSGGGTWDVLANASADGANRVRFDDRAVTAGTRYGYRLAWSESGRRITAGATFIVVPAAARFALHAVSSVGSAVELSLESPIVAEARVELFDVTGRRVAEARPRVTAAGSVRLTLGGHLSPGLYLARATQGGASARARMVVVR
jgi:hypothetical protein